MVWNERGAIPGNRCSLSPIIVNVFPGNVMKMVEVKMDVRIDFQINLSMCRRFSYLFLIALKLVIKLIRKIDWSLSNWKSLTQCKRIREILVGIYFYHTVDIYNIYNSENIQSCHKQYSKGVVNWISMYFEVKRLISKSLDWHELVRWITCGWLLYDVNTIQHCL